MKFGEEISICSQNYEKWKALALSSKSIEESKKYMQKAFFWLELHSAFLLLAAAEETKGKDPTFKQKLILAKARLSKKLSEYAEKLINDLNF
ncbi:MAG: hypothetical protein QXR09_03510 [Candidatus Aenigmatarchaeota archaeon]